MISGANSLPRFAAAEISNPSNKAFFVSPRPAGRRITAGFSWLQRIGKAASFDVWFPEALRRALNRLIEEGHEIGSEHFPAEWAAVRQFELLQEAGNYKIYDLDATNLTRTLVDLTRNMRAGGYRVTVATIGSYSGDGDRDDLELLDQRLQSRLSQLIHMLYLEEQSSGMNRSFDKVLAAGTWDYRTALPHVGMTLGAHDLFRNAGGLRQAREMHSIPSAPHGVCVEQAEARVADLGVTNAETSEVFRCVKKAPAAGEYAVRKGIYHFASADCGRDVMIVYMHNAAETGAPQKLSGSARKHKLARQFFDILSLLPQNHIVHDTAIGLQLPESINENEWIYLVQEEDTLRAFNSLLDNLFSPFDKMSLAGLDGRADAAPEVKATVQHMRGYGDRLTPGANQFYQNLARFAP